MQLRSESADGKKKAGISELRLMWRIRKEMTVETFERNCSLTIRHFKSHSGGWMRLS